MEAGHRRADPRALRNLAGGGQVTAQRLGRRSRSADARRARACRRGGRRAMDGGGGWLFACTSASGESMSRSVRRPADWTGRAGARLASHAHQLAVVEQQRQAPPRAGLPGDSPAASSGRRATPTVGRSRIAPSWTARPGPARMIAPVGIHQQHVRRRTSVRTAASTDGSSGSASRLAEGHVPPPPRPPSPRTTRPLPRNVAAAQARSPAPLPRRVPGRSTSGGSAPTASSASTGTRRDRRSDTPANARWHTIS